MVFNKLEKAAQKVVYICKEALSVNHNATHGHAGVISQV